MFTELVGYLASTLATDILVAYEANAIRVPAGGQTAATLFRSGLPSNFPPGVSFVQTGTQLVDTADAVDLTKGSRITVRAIDGAVRIFTLDDLLNFIQLRYGYAAVGVPGKSAYDLAVQNGFSGSVAQWLATLVGQPANLAELQAATAAAAASASEAQASASQADGDVTAAASALAQANADVIAAAGSATAAAASAVKTGNDVIAAAGFATAADVSAQASASSAATALTAANNANAIVAQAASTTVAATSFINALIFG